MSSIVPSASAQLALQDTQVQVTDQFRQQFRACMADPLFNFPDKTLSWIVDSVARYGMPVPIGQVIGFNQFTALYATVATNQTTASDSYVDLATVGPEITGLPDGQYVLLYGFLGFNSAATGGCQMGLQINATAPTGANDCLSYAPAFGDSVMVAIVATLADGNNTLTAKYKRGNSTGTANFDRRWLIALRYANS